MTLDESLHYRITDLSKDQWFLISNPVVSKLAPIYFTISQEGNRYMNDRKL
jgi:hypothetical protein